MHTARRSLNGVEDIFYLNFWSAFASLWYVSTYLSRVIDETKLINQPLGPEDLASS
jgi:hypothetical protein